MSVKTDGLELWACEWEDAHCNNGEFERDEVIHRSINYVTTGILVRADETGITFAADVSETGSFRGTNFIPRRMVVDSWKVGSLNRVPAPRATKRRKRQEPSESLLPPQVEQKID